MIMYLNVYIYMCVYMERERESEINILAKRMWMRYVLEPGGDQVGSFFYVVKSYGESNHQTK
jgi:hypothetical protein